jgi:ABC-type multidrug transport system fused ATPase/permease subunit
MKLFEGMVYKQLAWFDNKNRAPGILSNILSEDISALNGLTTEHIVALGESFLNLAIGVIIGLIYDWKISLITIALTPFVIVGSVLMSRLQWK